MNKINKIKTGVLLINLGTPSGPDKKSVRNFLKEFLDDPRVIDLPAWLRKLLLYFFILPTRPKKSAKAYQAIWDPKKGSPLLYHSQEFARELQAQLGENYHVELAMRYGQPDISQGIDAIMHANCQNIKVLPLFPQYSNAASGSAIDKLMQSLRAKSYLPQLKIYNEFYDHPEYIKAQAALIQPVISQTKPEGIIFSYHSLPQRQIEKIRSQCATACFQGTPCMPVSENNRKCYRAQCYETSVLLAEYLGIKSFEVAFQSRLGRTIWIGPDVSFIMDKMRNQGIKNVLVACPSFVADCLETLEEIGIRAKELWHEKGGNQFTLAPCMNSDPLWVDAVAKMIGSHSA